MTLGFSTKWPAGMGELAGQPNYFIEKIWYSLHWEEVGFQYYYYRDKHLEFLKKQIDGSYPKGTILRKFLRQKPHTIRQGNRWKAGDKIHPVINNRTKDRFQFAPTMVCTGVQDIEILYAFGWPLVKIYSDPTSYVIILGKNLEKLAKNDGFDSVEDFFAYFNTDFKGQIIHWTDLRY